MRKLALFVLLFAAVAHGEDLAKRRAIESELSTPILVEGVRGRSIEARMKELGVPALSFAVVENGKVVIAAAYGDADVGAKRKATATTLFQAASVSKPVTALAVMSLVESGKLSLDAPINSVLRTWRIPDNDLTKATPVTLRMLLSHSAGTNVHGFPGYAPHLPRPTVAQLLAGSTAANTVRVAVDLAPNTKFAYSGGGFTIVQQALTDATSVAFPTLMKRTVLDPLAMTASTFEQPLPSPRQETAATGYRKNGVEIAGKGHVYPEMAAAGLWTTPGDLAKVIIEVQSALAGGEARVLSKSAAKGMLTPRFPVSDNISMGLGFFVEKRGHSTYFSHDGSNDGFRAALVGSADGSHGAVVMTNSDNGGRLLRDVVNTIAREYKWPGFELTPLKVRKLSEKEAASIPGRYEFGPGMTLWIRRSAQGGLEVLDLITGWKPLYPIADGTFARADYRQRFTLERAKRLPADQKPNADELIASGDIDAAVKLYREAYFADRKSVPEATLNDAGYEFLSAGRLRQAIAILQLNTQLHPASANTWDSLADVLMIAGETERAIAASEEVLRRIDKDPNAPAGLRVAAEGRLRNLRKR